MTEPFYVSRASIEKIEGVHRRARLEAGAEQHALAEAQVKEHYRIDAKDLPLPVDYVVACTAG